MNSPENIEVKSYKDLVIKALKELNGHGYLRDIYAECEEIANKSNFHLSKNYPASIRALLERFSSDSAVFNGKEDLFFSVDGIGNGHWGLRNYQPDPKQTQIDLTQDDDEFVEGKRKLRKHIARERNQALIKKAKQNFVKKHGKLFCEVCEFDFEKVYGDIGKGFIEAHHIKPVSDMKENEQTKVEDIIMVCSNCHSMIHRRKPWLTKSELSKLL